MINSLTEVRNEQKQPEVSCSVKKENQTHSDCSFKGTQEGIFEEDKKYSIDL